MSEEQRRQLRQQLWNIADTLRGKMHADEFRDYILGFIFYKYLSEKIERFADSILEADERLFTSLKENNADDLEMIEAVKDASIEALGYFLRPNELFHAIAAKGNNKAKDEGSNFVIPDLTKIFKNIEHSTQGTNSEEKFINLFEDLDLTSSKLGSTEKAKNELITKILSHLVQIDFQLDNIEADVLGDAYEYLIGEFASGAGKKAGEFYTPQEVSKVLSKLVTCGNRNIRNVYDPTCGSGSLLLRVKKEAAAEHKIQIYGQELNRTTYNLARMNMLLHDVHYADFNIKQEDTLEHPQHLEHRFDAIVANPPFSAKWSANPLFNSDDRFGMYGKLAPSTKADMAFVQHMLYQLADDGVMAVVLPHGVLFRGAAEGHIRQYFIEKMNCLDAVIGLPANIFYGTSIPTCILVFKQCRKHPDDILFIDASKDFEKVKTQNMLLPEHIDKIIAVYENRSNEAKYSRIVSLAEIKANEYNLNIPRYVDSFEAEARVDLDAVAKEMYELEILRQDIDAAIKQYCEILSLPMPVGCNFFLWKEYKQGVMQRIFSQEIRFTDDDGREFPEWEEKEFSELVEKSSEKYNPDIEEEIYKCVELESLSQETGMLLETFNSNELKSIKNKFRKGNVLFGKLRPYLKKYLKANFDGVCSSEIWVFNGIKITNEFLYYLIQTEKFNSVANISSGSKMPRADWEYVSNSPFFYPKIEEQQKIADFLTAIDKKIELLIKQKRLLQLYKQGVMQRIFSQEIRFTDDDGREFPEWEEKELGEIGLIITGKTPSTTNESLWNGNIQFVTPTDITGGKYQFKTQRTVSNNITLKILPKNSIMFTCIASIGKMALSVNPCITNQQINSLIPDNSHNNEYVYYAVLNISEYIKSTKSNTTLPIINKTEFSKFEIPIPSLPEQTKIANFLTSLDEKIALY